MCNTITSGYKEQVQAFLQRFTFLRSSWCGYQRVDQESVLCFLVVVFDATNQTGIIDFENSSIRRSLRERFTEVAAETLMKQDVVCSKMSYLKCLFLLVCVRDCVCDCVFVFETKRARECLFMCSDHLFRTTSWRNTYFNAFYVLLSFLID